MLTIELNPNDQNHQFLDFSLERRDKIIGLGLFCEREGLQNLQELYSSKELYKLSGESTKRLGERCQTLESQISDLGETISRLQAEKVVLRESIIVELDDSYRSSYEQRLGLERKSREAIQAELDILLTSLGQHRDDLAKSSEREFSLKEQQYLEKLEYLESSHEKELQHQREMAEAERHLLEERLADRQNEINRWNLGGTGRSGNVVKGNIGEAILINLLRINLPAILGVECNVSDVSKGKGGNGDLLIEIPSRDVNILIESKYKNSEKVRTKEIERMRKDVVTNTLEANIIVGVSFMSSFTGYGNRHIEFISSSGGVKVLSLIDNFNKMCDLDGGLGLCHWIDFISRVYSSVRGLVGHSSRAILLSIMSDVERVLCLVDSLERQAHDRLLKGQDELRELQTLRLSLLPQILHKLQLGSLEDICPTEANTKTEIIKWLREKDMEVTDKCSKKELLEMVEESKNI